MEGKPLTSLVDHLSSFLGAPVSTDRVPLDRSGRCIDLLRFKEQPCDGATTVVTDGLRDLEHHRLDEELLLACWSEELSTDLLLVIEFVARQLAEGREPLARGDVIGPAGPLVPGTEMEALYVCDPSYFPDDLAVFETLAGSEVWLRWLIPIHAREVRFIMEQGASVFEGMLEREDPDLLSLRRPAVSAAG